MALTTNADVTMRLKKYKFLTKTIDYFGHDSRPRRLGPAPVSRGALFGLRAPVELTDLRLSLVLCNVLRRFVPNLACIVVPVNRKPYKDQPSTFKTLNEEEKNLSANLKNSLNSPFVLALLSTVGHMTHGADPFDVQEACALLQL